MSREEWAQVVTEESEEWRDTAELLNGETGDVGVLSLQSGTEVLNGSMKELGAQEFHIDDVEAVRGHYMIFPEYMVEGVNEQVGARTLGPEDVNDANFYVGHSSGVPWFELKFEEDYTVPGREEPHTHNAWEFYGFHGGEAVLDVAGEDYDFMVQDPESWEYRDDVDEIHVPEGEVLGVPPGVPHKVNTQEGNPHLVVARYSSEGDIGRYNLEGERIDPWSEKNQDVRMRTYPEALD